MFRFPSANRNHRFLFSFDKLKGKELFSLFSPFYWCLGPLHMRSVTGRVTWENKTKIVDHKLVSFATFARLCRLFQLYYNLCSGKTHQTKIMPFLPLCWDGEAFLSKNVSSRLPGLECSYGKIFIPNTKISVAKSEISVTGAARFSSEENYFFPKKRAARWDLGNRASSVDRAHMKRPSSSNTYLHVIPWINYWHFTQGKMIMA